MGNAWAEQEALRKTHKRPQTEEEAKAIGWKIKLQVRIEAYKQAIKETDYGLVEGIKKLQKECESISKNMVGCRIQCKRGS